MIIFPFLSSYQIPIFNFSRSIFIYYYPLISNFFTSSISPPYYRGILTCF
nr:MAG TPA: hypothetical protein [Bacteriophage sp.]